VIPFEAVCKEVLYRIGIYYKVNLRMKHVTAVPGAAASFIFELQEQLG
jgi:hypothetical protein